MLKLREYYRYFFFHTWKLEIQGSPCEFVAILGMLLIALTYFGYGITRSF